MCMCTHIHKQSDFPRTTGETIKKVYISFEGSFKMLQDEKKGTFLPQITVAKRSIGVCIL